MGYAGNNAFLNPGPTIRAVEEGKVDGSPGVVPVPMGPDDCFDVFAIDTGFFELLADALLNSDLPVEGFHKLDDPGREVLDIFPYAQIKEQFAA